MNVFEVLDCRVVIPAASTLGGNDLLRLRLLGHSLVRTAKPVRNRGDFCRASSDRRRLVRRFHSHLLSFYRMTDRDEIGQDDL